MGIVEVVENKMTDVNQTGGKKKKYVFLISSLAI